MHSEAKKENTDGIHDSSSYNTTLIGFIMESIYTADYEFPVSFEYCNSSWTASFLLAFNCILD